MKSYAFLLCLLLISNVTALKGNIPHEQKPADVETFERTTYLNILNSPPQVYDSCEPFYKRVFYNIDNIPEAYKRTIEHTNDEEQYRRQFGFQYNLRKVHLKQDETQQPLDMYIYFNTNISCPKSYVHVEIFSTKIFKFSCIEEKLHLQANESIWEQYVHRCRVFVPIEKASSVDSFTYKIYAQVVNFQDENQVKHLQNQKIQSLRKKQRTSDRYEVELVRKQITTKMVVLGDWAPIKVRPYLPIHESLYHFVEQRKKQKQLFPLKHQYRITALVIAGDIAYNLQDFNCMKYNWFMSQLEKVSPYWPIIICPGNHEDDKPGNRYLLSKSFQIGRMAVIDGNYTRVKWMRFPHLINFVMFDPFYEVYGIATPQQTRQMSEYLKATLDEIQQKYPNEFTFVMTHYPIACSQMDDYHCNSMLFTPETKELLDFMSTSRNGKPRPVDIYVGSHMHQYQRVFPYANGTFQIGEKSVYGRGHMVSVVEGAAGCDVGIIVEDFPRKDFSVSATFAKTGYAVMTIYGTADLADKSKYILNYVHKAAKPAPQYYEDVDEFTIYGQVPKKDKSDQPIEILNLQSNDLKEKISKYKHRLQQLIISK